MEISKSAVVLSKEHQSDMEKIFTNYFRINICYVFVQAKTTLSMECWKM